MRPSASTPGGELDVDSWRLEVDVGDRSWTARTRSRRLREGLGAVVRERMQRQGRFTFDHLP